MGFGIADPIFQSWNPCEVSHSDPSWRYLSLPSIRVTLSSPQPLVAFQGEHQQWLHQIVPAAQLPPVHPSGPVDSSCLPVTRLPPPSFPVQLPLRYIGDKCLATAIKNGPGVGMFMGSYLKTQRSAMGFLWRAPTSVQPRVSLPKVDMDGHI